MAELVKDLVCGMEIDPETAAGKSEHQGKTYYFCATGCKTDFDADPAKYIGGGAAAPAVETATATAEPAAATPAGGAATPKAEPAKATAEPAAAAPAGSAATSMAEPATASAEPAAAAPAGGASEETSEKRWWEFWK